MRFTVDASSAVNAGRRLQQGPERIRQQTGRMFHGIGELAAGYIKTQFRSGPTTGKTTQVRSNRLRASYASRVHQEAGAMLLDVGLIQSSTEGRILFYGALMEGRDPQTGNRFVSKIIRAKGGGWLRFPLYDPQQPGVARSNILGWVTTKQITFKPRPSFDAVRLKFAPMIEQRLGEIIPREAL